MVSGVSLEYVAAHCNLCVDIFPRYRTW